MSRDGRAIGGVSLLILKTVPHSLVNITTNLQAVAVRVTLHRAITLCSLYLPPNTAINNTELDHLIRQLPSPIVLMGDFNAHSPLWGCQTLDAKGKIIEDFLSNNNLCFLNNKNMFTYIHPATGSKTSIDLTICDPSLVVDLDWTVHDDLCGSDHYPIIVKCSKPQGIQAVQRWKLTKADWDSFSVLCEQRLTAERFGTVVNEAETFTTSLQEIAHTTIPKSKISSKTVCKPWFNEDCKTAICERKKALRALESSPTAQNLSTFLLLRAKARRTIRSAKSASWQNFVSGLNYRTPIKKAWDMVRKIHGKMPSVSIKHLNFNNTLITDLK